MSGAGGVLAVLDNLCHGVAPAGHEARMLRAAVAESISAAGDAIALRSELIRVYRSIGNDLLAAEHEAALARVGGEA